MEVRPLTLPEVWRLLMLMYGSSGVCKKVKFINDSFKNKKRSEKHCGVNPVKVHDVIDLWSYKKRELPGWLSQSLISMHGIDELH